MQSISQSPYTPTFSYTSKADPAKIEWDAWWDGIEDIQEAGSYREEYPFSSRYFQALMGQPFFKDSADSFDEKVMGLFMAVESREKKLVAECLGGFEDGDPANTGRILTAALYLADELQIQKISDILKTKLKGELAPFGAVDKAHKTALEKPIPETAEVKEPGLSTTAKVALIALIILAGITLGYFLYQSYNQPVTLPYDLGRDLSGTPIQSCNHPDLWPAHERMIKEAVQSCKMGSNLGELANTEGAKFGLPDWDLSIRPAHECLTKAQAYLNQNRVIICCDNQEPVSSTLFELGNLRRNGEFREVIQGVQQGIITNRDAFAYETERVEYGTAQDHNDHLTSCIKELGWKEPSAYYPKINWNKWWKWISPSKHTEAYRIEFDQMKAVPMAAKPETGIITSIFEKFKSLF